MKSTIVEIAERCAPQKGCQRSRLERKPGNSKDDWTEVPDEKKRRGSREGPRGEALLRMCAQRRGPLPPRPGLPQDAHREQASWSKSQLLSIFQEGLRVCKPQPQITYFLPFLNFGQLCREDFPSTWHMRSHSWWPVCVCGRCVCGGCVSVCGVWCVCAVCVVCAYVCDVRVCGMVCGLCVVWYCVVVWCVWSVYVVCVVCGVCVVWYVCVWYVCVVCV